MKTRTSLAEKILFSLGLAAICGIAWALTYQPPASKSTGDSLTAGEWNTVWSNLGNWANGQIGNVNISPADPIAKSNLDFDLTNDGTANDAYAIQDADIQSVAINKFTSLRCAQRASPGMAVDVAAGFFLKPDATGTFAYPTGGAALTMSPVFVAPGSNSRIDLLSVDNDGTLSIAQGTAAVSPVPPTYPTDKIPLCEIFLRSSSTSILNTDNGSQGYIKQDARPIISASGTVVTTNIIKHTLILSHIVAEDFNWSATNGLPVGVPDGWHTVGDVIDTGIGHTGALRFNGSGAIDSELLFARRLVYPALNDSVLEFRAKLSLANPQNIFMGLIKGSPQNAGGADGCFFQHGTGNNKLSVTCRNGGPTNTQADVQPAAWDWTAYHTFKITYTKTNVQFDIDGTQVGVDETTVLNIPQAATDTLHLGMYGTAGAGQGIIIDSSLGYFVTDVGLAP